LTRDHDARVEWRIADACHNPWVSTVRAALAPVFSEILSQTPLRPYDARIDLDTCKEFYEDLVLGRGEEACGPLQGHFDTLEDIAREDRG